MNADQTANYRRFRANNLPAIVAFIMANHGNAEGLVRICSYGIGNRHGIEAMQVAVDADRQKIDAALATCWKANPLFDTFPTL